MDGWHALREELGDALKKIRDLPSASRGEVRDDLDVLRRLILNHREPRIAIVGQAEVSLHEVLGSLGTPSEWDDVREQLGHGRWYEHTFEHGMLQLADLRGENALRALEYQQADVVLAVARSENEEIGPVVQALVDAMEVTDDVFGSYPGGLGVVYRANDGRNAGDFKTMQAFKDAFEARELDRNFVEVVSTARPPALSRKLLTEVPLEARFTLARLTDDAATKRELAFELTRLAATLNAAIASVPIPVASAVPITSVQIAMVSGIAMLSGRRMNLRTVGEFTAAIGLNVGAAVAFRELARALIALIPVAGPVISASIAAGATLTLGKAASRYFLDG